MREQLKVGWLVRGGKKKKKKKKGEAVGLCAFSSVTFIGFIIL